MSQVFVISFIVFVSVFFVVAYALLVVMKDDFLKQARIEGEEVNQRFALQRRNLSESEKLELAQKWYHSEHR